MLAYRDKDKILTHLCVALGTLAVQMHEWQTVVQDAVAAFGQDLETGFACLLEFLLVLPEQVCGGWCLLAAHVSLSCCV